MKLHSIVVGALGACLSACAGQSAAPVIERNVASNPAAPSAVAAAAPAKEESSGVVVRPLRDTGVSVPTPRESAAPAPSAAAPANPAVVALLNAAREQGRAGEHDRAAASLERALEIEPKNAWIWYRLATTRYEQGRFAEAEQLAVRSNHLAGDDRQLLAGNWALIAAARSRAGDASGAELAQAQSERYARATP